MLKKYVVGILLDSTDSGHKPTLDSCEEDHKLFVAIKGRTFLECLSDYQFL
jgi:hypothetical protein